MPTVRETRKDNLLRAIRRAGSKVELARALALQQPSTSVETFQSYLSQLTGKRGSRAIGDDFARAVERAVRWPEGFMDVPHPDKQAVIIPMPDALTDTGLHLARSFERFGPEARDLATKLFDEIAKQFPPKPPRKKRKR